MKRDDHEKGRGCSRRDFLVSGVTAAAGIGVSLASCTTCSPKSQPPEGPPPAVATERKGMESDSAVVTRTDPKALTDERRARDLVNRAICDLVDLKDHKEAFRALFDPSDVVAIKPNCLAGPGLSSTPAVVAALVQGLRDIGIGYRDIIIWERSDRELEKAGFELNMYSDFKPRCYGNDTGGFGRDIETSGEVGSLWSNALAGRATALINVPVLKDHDLSGVGCGMKNMYGAIHNPNRYHDDNCDPFVAHVSDHPYVRDKLRLVLTDALSAQYHGGPAQARAHQWKPSMVLASRDPVAMDAVAWEVIEKERAAHGLASLKESNRPPKWLKTAAALGLGENDPSKIRRI